MNPEPGPEELDPCAEEAALLDCEERPSVGSEVERELSRVRPGDTPDYRRQHPLDCGPHDGPELLDDHGEPWSNL